MDLDLFHRVKKGDLDYIKTVTADELLNARDENGRSVISAAVEENQFDCCKEILKKCPSLLYFQTYQVKNTILHEAIYYNRYALIDYFLSVGLDAATNEEGSFMKWINLKNLLGDTALTMAASKQLLHTVKRLIEVDREYKLGLSEKYGHGRWTALQLAVMNQDQEMIKLLTDKGDPYSDYIPFSFAMDLFDHVKNGDLDYVKTVTSDVLLKSRDNEDRNSALGVATKYNQLGCCEEILKRCPILLYHQNNLKETVLHNSITNYKLVDFFVGVGIDMAAIEGNTENMQCFKNWINLQNCEGDTALCLAVVNHNHDVVKRLVQVDRQYKLGLSEITDFGEETPLQLALEYEDQEMIKLLTEGTDLDLEHGANTNGNSFADIKFKSGTSVASEHKMFTLDEVSKHNNSGLLAGDQWQVCSIPKSLLEQVYDVTNFFETHPGGDKVLLKAAGKDATNDFKLVHSHSSNTMAMMDKFYVGVYDSITSLLIKLASDKPQPYSHEQLVDFTEDFSHSLGSGGFGDVYKGKLPNGVLIAVKVLKDIDGKEMIMEEQFAAEVDTMGRTYHRNLIKLYGYCYDASTKFKALIYDYMESGSFDTVLFEKKLDLPWEKLHNIAKEIAHGISYLHESCYPQIIHQDIKPANILLDSNLSPKLIDFGLAKVNMGESQFEQTKIKGTRNYMAPEVNQPNQVKLSCKCDVYSFGMMMFDILGSKRNHVDRRFWFPSQVWEKFSTNQLDKFILDCGIKEVDKDNAKRLSVVALLCVEHNPVARPMMSTVVKMLEGKVKLDTPVTPFYPNYYSASDSSSMSDSRDA